MTRPAVYPSWVFDDSEIPDPLGCGQRAVDFLRVLRHPKSTAPGRRFTLAPFQERIIRRIYGPRHDDGRRKVKTCFLMIGRGGRKTALGAALSLLHFIGPERQPGGLVLNAASDREQARLAFEESAAILREDPRIETKLSFQDYRHRIGHPKSGTLLRAVSSDAGRQHGSTPAFALVDELHAHRSRDLWDVVRTGLVKTPDSLLVVTTTAGRGQDSIAWDIYDYARKVALGEIEDDGFLPILFQSDREADFRDESAWAWANPGLADGFPDVEGLRQLAREAENRPSDREAFRQLHMNVWLDHATDPFVEMAVYDKGAVPVDLAAMEGRPCWVGIDLSSVNDLTAAVACWRLDDGRLAVHPWFFCPEEGLRRRQERDGVPYVRWAEEGHIIATPGDTVDYRAVEDHLREVCDRFDVRELAFDPYKAQGIAANLMEDGLPVAYVRQGALTLGPMVFELERAIVGGQMLHGGHPVLRWNFANAQVKEANGLKTLHKPYKSSTDRIDGAVACAMAVGRAVAGDGGGSIYNDDDARPEGLLIL